MKQAFQLKKDLKKCKREQERLELENMKLKLDIERRVVEFLDSTQDIFGVVDSLFTEEDVRTLNEAKQKWFNFKNAINSGMTIEEALDVIDRTPVHTTEKNALTLSNLWRKNKMTKPKKGQTSN